MPGFVPPRRLRSPSSPYRGGYASAGRLAGRGASTLSVHGLFRNGPLEAGGLRYQTLPHLRPPPPPPPPPRVPGLPANKPCGAFPVRTLHRGAIGGEAEGRGVRAELSG